MTDISLEEAQRLISNAVYRTCAFIEVWESQGLICGNGHHIRQEAATNVAELVASHWKSDHSIKIPR